MSAFRQISLPDTLTLPRDARILSNSIVDRFPLHMFIDIYPEPASCRTSRAISRRGRLEIPLASTFYTPVTYFATMHQPPVRPSIPDSRTTNPALARRDPPYLLTHDTTEILSPLISIGSPLFSGKSLPWTIIHHAVKNMLHSSSIGQIHGYIRVLPSGRQVT